MKEIVLGLGAMAVAATGLTPQKADVTYTETIRPVIAAKCLPCHSKATNIGPFDFSTYDGVASRIELIRTQVLSRNMPPIWAHSDYGKFSNIEHFSVQEAIQLQDWIRLKMPIGPPINEKRSDERTTVKSKHSEALTKPDLTLSLAKNVKVHAESVPYWSVFTVDLPSKGGRIELLKVIPSNPRVLRNATIAIVPKSRQLPSQTFGSMDLPAESLIGTWAPGYRGLGLPKGMSRTYDPDSKLVVQVHYRPTGKAEDGSFRVEVFNTKTGPTTQPSWITIEKSDVLVPAGKSETIELKWPVKKDLLILSVLPEARFYASRVELTYTSREGKTSTVYNNMRWDPYWIGNFMFMKPVSLAKGGTLAAKFYYNNDEFCQINDGKKPKAVHAGPSASDEVCRMHLLVGP